MEFDQVKKNIPNIQLVFWKKQYSGTSDKEFAFIAGDTRDMGLISGSGRSSGVGNGNPPQYSCWENSMDRGAWRAIVHGVAKSWTRLNECAQAHFSSNIF